MTPTKDVSQQQVSLDWQPFAAFFDKLRGTTEPRELLTQLLHGLVTILRAGRGFVMLKTEGTDELVPVASWQVRDEAEFLKISKTVYTRALVTESLVFLEDSTDDEWLQSASMESLSLLPRSILCGPLAARGKVFGVIYLDGDLGRSDIDGTKIPLFQTVVALASELLSAVQTRGNLLAAQGKLDAINQLAWEDERLVLGEGSASKQLKELLRAAAQQNVSVLVTGDTGTGKEMVARALHRMSPRAGCPFVPVHCSALPRDIIEAELFGAEKGAYTGAAERRIGRFELAAGGTLFLDEIGDLEQDIQIKLLRILQERTITRLGGTQPISLDFRLVCATNRDLEAAVKDGSFRQDLYYRINVFRVHLLPLRDRVEDIKPLAEYFRESLASRFGKKVTRFTREAMDAIQKYAWPGNIRELRNAVERAVVVEATDAVRPESLPINQPMPRSTHAGDLLGQLLDSLPPVYDQASEIFERAFLERAMRQAKENIAAMARDTGIPRNTLYRRLAKFEMLGERGERGAGEEQS